MKKLVSLFLLVTVVLGCSAFDASAEDIFVAATQFNVGSELSDENYERYLAACDEILNEINAEYGTNMHRVTKEEALRKLDIVLPDRQDNIVRMSLDEFEQDARNRAEIDLPLYAKIDREAREKANKYERNSPKDTNTSESIASVYVEASKPITYADALLFGYVGTNSVGSPIWTSVVNLGSHTNTTWAHFWSGDPTTFTYSIIDLGRTATWNGYGDYYHRSGGILYYDGSGSQYTEFYAMNYDISPLVLT